MSRLTEIVETRCIEGYRIKPDIEEDAKAQKWNYYDAVKKLGQLEDIEEELGIDLVTLFKALRNGFYHLDSCYEDITSPLTQSEFDLLLREVSE